MRQRPGVTAQGGARWVLLFGLWLIYFCFGLMIATMAPLIGPISAELGVGNATMGLILGAWPLTYVAAAIPCGILLDRIGVRRMLMLATAIMAASGVARGLAQSPAQLLLAVGLFGFGGPMISIGAPKLVARMFHGSSRGTAMGIYVTGPYLGGIVSLALTNSVVLPLVGGDWRDVMFFFSGIVALSGVIWLGLASLPAQRAQTGDNEAGRTYDLGAFAELLRLPDVRIVLAMSIGIFFINHGLNNWLPELLRSRGMSAVQAGYWSAFPGIVGIAGALIVPRLATPKRRLRILGALFAAALAASLLLQLGPGIGLTIGLFLQGLSRGSLMAVTIILLMELPSVPKDRLGLAGGLFFTMAEIGGVLGPLAFGVLSDLTGGFTVPLAVVTAIAVTLLMLLTRLRI